MKDCVHTGNTASCELHCASTSIFTRCQTCFKAGRRLVLTDSTWSKIS